MKRFLPFIGIFVLVFIFFWQFFLKGLLPIPADTIVGLYNPYRDFYQAKYPRGIPYKNFLITDPVRQQYPWKSLAISQESKGEIPLWNPYEMAGKPLLANFQSGSFYPLNLLFVIKPFYTSWSIYIVLGTFLSLIFAYLYLNNLELSKTSSLFGSLTFAFSGFSIAWLEWGNITHTILWLPLILLAIDKIFEKRKNIKWISIFILSLMLSFFAGHLQLFFYVFILSIFYFVFKLFGERKDLSKILILAGSIFIFSIATFYQWFPTLQYILQSARSIDQDNWQKIGWFIPWQNLIQFIAPDFFGNPATLNYWGIFNYGEFIGYIGILPLIFSLFSLFLIKNRTVFFFGLTLFVSLIFAYPTFLAKIPFMLNIPLISTAQPTRLIFIADFSLAVLTAFGLDYLSKFRKSKFYILAIIGFLFVSLWLFILKFPINSIVSPEEISVAKNNLILPSLLFLLSSMLITANSVFRKIPRSIFVWLIILISVFDLFRFGWKFTPFTASSYLYPNTPALTFLNSHIGNYRVLSANSQILPPNFLTMYRIQTIDGYDPLYLKNYAQLIVSLERNTSDINPPFGFNRIITPHNYSSEITDLLGVKYVLSLTDLSSPKLEKVFQEGETRIYENKNVLPRVFFVTQTISADNNKDTAREMFKNKDSLKEIAVVNDKNFNFEWSSGNAVIKEYRENRVIIQTQNKGKGFLLLTDSFYPTWHAKIDSKEAKIERTDLNFRGLVVPPGVHNVEFYISLL